MAVNAPVAPTEIQKPVTYDPQGIADKIQALYPTAVESVSAQGIVLKSDTLLDVARYLHDTLAFDYLHNVTSVDWMDHLEVVYHMSSLERGGAPLTLKVNTSRDNPSVPSLMPVYLGADLQEREVYDMMGIRFEGHPNLKRVLLWEGFEGYPLRKDWREPYYEEDKKPFGTRWDQGHHVISEDRNPWHDNVQYPAGFDPNTYKPVREEIRHFGEPAATIERLRTDRIVVNIGPQHPSTHGVLRLRTTIDGETVVSVDPVLGYLHRNHEKIGERNTYLQNMPFTDRLDYFTSMSNNVAYAVAVEKLTGAKVPERAEYLRVIMAELTRVVSHLGLIGFLFNDLGAFYTPLLYGLEEREKILDLFEEAAGSRMMCNYARFGGVARDVSDDWLERARYMANERLPRAMDEMEAYLVGNEIFLARSKGVGILTREKAINYSAAGPILRASGVKYDVRRADPYSIYDRFDFEVPTGKTGDLNDRFMMRMWEIRESIKILKQALAQISTGEILTGKKNYQVRVPKGEAYGHGENPKGELGFYLVSDGTANPYRYHVRAPSYINLTCLNEMAKGHKIADLIVILGSIDVVMGEVDR